ncbi:protein of unknown function [Chryseobacterium ureilyticum]|uniref:Uncharacterized protein n=1 Tax=Chryseobacterium ureilyticum TaxID=373668 RepID=A0A1N7P469_9FLAO|nr:SusF/SusE family outer membrane protein [Chryseobacterium ureilyticum]SIT05336.1 protein of unknown function [Chryseobacterium ureilyticum]
MKNFLKILTITAISILCIACSKDEDQVILNETAQSKISVDKTTLVLDKNQLNDVAVNFTLVKPTFNIAVVSTQQIELDIQGNDFKQSKFIDVVDPTVSLTNKDFNALILALGGAVNVPNQIDVRLKTKVGSAYYYSNMLTLTVTPYMLGPNYNYTDLYLIGDATAAGWENVITNTKFHPLQKTTTTGVYSYTGYFAAGGFKLIQNPGSWDTQYGMGGSEGMLSASGSSGNISVGAAGFYKLTINANSLTYTLTAITPPVNSYTTISMVGTASGDWNTDTDLQKSAFNSHFWIKKNVTMNAGEFKFRADHDWGTSWGTAQEFFGIAAVGGANIPLSTSFKYDVYFNDITGEFSVIPVY